MARRTTTSTLQRVRRVLLFGLVLFVSSLVGLYLFGRRPPSEPASLDRTESPGGPEVTIVGNEFRYEVTEAGEKLFDIEADRLLSDELDLYILEGVKITMQREDDVEYSITADNGTYRLELNEASLQGNVGLAGSGGLRLTTEGLELRRRGKVVVSSGPVSIVMGTAYRGRADRLEMIFSSNRIILAGRVELETAPGAYPRATLRARRTVFFRDTHSFLAEGNVELRRESDTLRARRLSLNFDENDRKILFARASWNVKATLRQFSGGGLPSIAQVAGDDLSVAFNEATGDPERLEIDAPDGGWAQLQVTDASALRRSMRADYLWADFANGHLQRAQGLGGVTLEEDLEFAPKLMLRQICSDSAQVSYDATGSLTNLSLDGEVIYQELDLQAGGDRLATLGDSAPIDLTGDLAWISNPDGRFEAPQIHFDRQAGRAQALGGVRAEIRSGSSPELALGEASDQPVRIEAQRAQWTREPPRFEFQQDVRAWQGENFLISQTLEIADGELLAGGGVRSVWHKRTAPLAEPAAEEEPPLTIAATRMRFNRDERRLVYEGSSQIVQGGRSMRCPLLQLELNEADQFERMYCEGGTLIQDDEGGSKISGYAAIYNTAAGKVKILGEPVRLVQTAGGTISARLMVYDFESAIAEIDSVKDEDAELFMTASEYFQQFGAPAVPPEAGDAAAGVAQAGVENEAATSLGSVEAQAEDEAPDAGSDGGSGTAEPDTQETADKRAEDDGPPGERPMQ
ncbi:MAG: hypothetical protein O7A04_09920 [Acidobacteria bacterium]|nr:hypothetical protein [Acidobacteriota bacterium]